MSGKEVCIRDNICTTEYGSSVSRPTLNGISVKSSARKDEGATGQTRQPVTLLKLHNLM